ncbi:MAG: sialate O-acetylesterase, partial [Planctomycetota bacterium]
MAHQRLILLLAATLLGLPTPAHAELWLPSIFGDHMVLQRDEPVLVWGRAAPGSRVTVSIAGGPAGQSRTTTTAVAGADGAWRVVLEPLSPGTSRRLTVSDDRGGQRAFNDVAVGEVWVCSGQSNMEWPVAAAMNADLELLSADRPDIRLISVPNAGSQTPLDDFPGAWEPCTPAAAAPFSAVGYYFGRRLHEVLGVPIGLIDNAWGGSAAEAWTPRERLTADPVFATAAADWAEQDRAANAGVQTAKHEAALQKWRQRADRAAEAGRRPPERPKPRGWLLGNRRPGNLFEARVSPIAGYGVRGVIWYQGESNAARAAEYRTLFPLMIESWRDAWRRPRLPFYWVQLADFRDESDQPQDTDWARLREAQTLTLDRLSDTGQAVIIDLGEANDIHPRNKHEVANRLARIALAKQYGYDLPHESPRLAAFDVTGRKAVVTLSPVGERLRAVDHRDVRGFTIAGEDRQWRWARARLLGEGRVELSHPDIAEPVAVRYAWGDNPV